MQSKSAIREESSFAFVCSARGRNGSFFFFGFISGRSLVPSAVCKMVEEQTVPASLGCSPLDLSETRLPDSGAHGRTPTLTDLNFTAAQSCGLVGDDQSTELDVDWDPSDCETLSVSATDVPSPATDVASPVGTDIPSPVVLDDSSACCEFQSSPFTYAESASPSAILEISDDEVSPRHGGAPVAEVVSRMRGSGPFGVDILTAPFEQCSDSWNSHASSGEASFAMWTTSEAGVCGRQSAKDCWVRSAYSSCGLKRSSFHGKHPLEGRSKTAKVTESVRCYRVWKRPGSFQSDEKDSHRW